MHPNIVLGSSLAYGLELDETGVSSVLASATVTAPMHVLAYHEGLDVLVVGGQPGVGIAHGLVVAFARSRALRDASRTVRDHGDAIINHSEWILRLGAIGLWAYSVLGLLALRERASGAIDAAAAFSVGYGTFSLALGDVVAFLFTLWLAWILSRFARVLLEKEVYPRVHLPRGLRMPAAMKVAMVLAGCVLTISPTIGPIEFVRDLIG